MKDIFYLIKTILLFLRNKGIIGMLILFFIIWWLFIEPSSYAATQFDEPVGSVDVYDYYKTSIDMAQLKYMYFTIKNLGDGADVNNVSQIVKDDINFMFKTGNLVFYNYDISNLFSGFDTSNKDFVYAVRVEDMEDTTITMTWKPSVINSSFNAFNFNYPGYNITSGSYTKVNPGSIFSTYSHIDNLDGVTARVPAGLFGYYNDTFYDWASSVYNGTFKISDASYWLSVIYNQINSTNEKLDDVNDELDNIANEISETNDFLKDENVDDNTMNLPSDNNNDVTSDYFNSIFEKFRTYMTTSSPISIEIPIPFADSGFTIESDITQKMVEGTIIQPLLSSVWFFLVGLYILKDVEQLIDKVKNR